MNSFEFLRPNTWEAAVRVLGETKGAALKAGGIDLLDRMKERVDEFDAVVGLLDVQGEARAIARNGDVVRIGALVTLSAIAASDLVPDALREAAAQAASLQIRNRATVGGNLAQHTRCGYYRLGQFPCWKRGSEACPVLRDGAVQEGAAIFANSVCASAHPSSLAPAFGSLRALVHVAGPKGSRVLGFADLWAEPRRGQASDLALAHDEVITAIDVSADGWRTAHEEVRQKAAFDWPLVVAAAALRADGDKIAEASIWLGSVAPTPWWADGASALFGQTYSEDLAASAGEAAAQRATPPAGNAYKTKLVKVAVKRAIVAAWGRA